jgi:hypothetical protein
MRRPPNEWINWAARYEVSDELVGQVIAGPFHAQGCNGQLREDWSITPGQRPIVDPVCPVCRVELWNPLARIKLFDLRWQVLQELQRLHRGGQSANLYGRSEQAGILAVADAVFAGRSRVVDGDLNPPDSGERRGLVAGAPVSI